MKSNEQRLIAWARDAVGTPFVWGQTDCSLIALSAIDQMCGTSHADLFRGAWASQDQALAHFALEMPSVVLIGLGFVERDPEMASVGDILTVPVEPWPEQLSVVLGSQVLCADIERGVCLMPLRLFSHIPGARAWRMG